MNSINDFYKNWMDSQSSMMKNWMDAAQTPAYTNGNGKAHKAEASANPYPTVLEAQMQFMKQWIDSTTGTAANMRELMSGKPANDGSAVVNFYEQWVSSQQDLMKRWMDSTRKSQTLMTDYVNAGASTSNAMTQMFKLYDSWKAVSNTWATPAQSPFGTAFGSMADVPHKFQDMLKNVFGQTNAYTKMMEFWMPMFRAMQEYPMDVEKLREYANPVRYKEALDNVFEFASPAALNNYMEQMQAFTHNVTASTQDMTKRMASMMEKNTQALSEMMMGNPDQAMKLYNAMMTNYRKAFDTMSDLAGVKSVRRDTEMAKLTNELMKRSTEYLSKMTQFQYTVYTTGQKTMETMLEKATETAQKPEIFESYDAFFKAWSEMNEDAYNSLFKSKEFVAMQKEIVGATAEVRETFQSLMEIVLQDYPIVLRSEVEELQKTVTDLQKKFRELATDDEAKPAAKTTTAKATVKR